MSNPPWHRLACVPARGPDDLARRPRLPLGSRHAALVLWGTWFYTGAAYFSVAGRFHRYYLVMLAPAITTLVGIGVVALWKNYRRPGWLLPLVLVGTAAVQVYILWDYEGWPLWLGPVISGLCLVAAAILAVARLRRSRPEAKTSSSLLAGAAAAGMLVLLVAPTAWSSYITFEGVAGCPPPVPGPSRRTEDRAGPEAPRAAAVLVAGAQTPRWWSICRPTGATPPTWSPSTVL